MDKRDQNLCADYMDAILSIKSNLTVSWICIKCLQMHLQLCEKSGADITHKVMTRLLFQKSILHSMFVRSEL